MVYLRDCMFLRAIPSHQSDGNGAWQQSVETYTILMSQVRSVRGSRENKMEQLYTAASNRVMTL